MLQRTQHEIQHFYDPNLLCNMYAHWKQFVCVCEFILKKSFPDVSEQDKSSQTADWPGAAASCAFEVKSGYLTIFLSFYIQHWSTCWTMSTVLPESDFEICLFTFTFKIEHDAKVSDANLFVWIAALMNFTLVVKALNLNPDTFLHENVSHKSWHTSRSYFLIEQ